MCAVYEWVDGCVGGGGNGGSRNYVWVGRDVEFTYLFIITTINLKTSGSQQISVANKNIVNPLSPTTTTPLSIPVF